RAPPPWYAPPCRWKRPASARTPPAHRHRFPGLARRDHRAPVWKRPVEYCTPTERARTSLAHGRSFRGLIPHSGESRVAVRSRACGEIISERTAVASSQYWQLGTGGWELGTGNWATGHCNKNRGAAVWPSPHSLRSGLQLKIAYLHGHSSTSEDNEQNVNSW